MVKQKRRLNLKQLAFVKEFCVDLNVTQAAKRAGYSERTAYSIGHELLKKPEIQELVQKERHQIATRNDLTIDRIVKEFQRIGFAQTTDMVTLKGGWVHIKDTDDLTPDQKAAISQIRQNKEGEIEVKFYDKLRALENLGKYLGMFDERITHEHHNATAPNINVNFGTVQAEPSKTIVDVESKERDSE